MPDIPRYPAAEARYDTVSHHREMFSGPDAAPYRFNWRAVHGTQLAQDFKNALKRLEGLLYALWGGQPMYAAGKQWHAREHPRCRWGVEQWWQQPKDWPGYFWNYLETAARGQLRAGTMPSVPVRSRSGDPAVQFHRAGHVAYFPRGSVQRYCGSPGVTGHQVHDPAGLFKQFPDWPDAENVVIRYTKPPGLPEDVVTLQVISTLGAFAMIEVEPGVWEATVPAQTQNAWIDWFVHGVFDGIPDDNHYDPFVGTDPSAHEIMPVLLGRRADPEHDRPAYAAYSFVFFSHHNPYAGGLPELLDETPPHLGGNWLRRGTDEYRFDASEDIQPGLINLARFVLDQTGKLFHHDPNKRGDAANCCVPMPIEFRWSGTHTPDLYRTGGKDVGGHPLHNNPTESDSGSQDARKSWRGIEMAWADADTIPGFFPDNWLYGDSESWLSWPELILLYPGDPPLYFPILRREYAGRGLQPGDVIDPVHVQEIIDAVDYLCTNGLWTTVLFSTSPLTIDDAWGEECGSWASGIHQTGTYSGCNENEDVSGVALENQCCASYEGGICTPYEKPAWEDCAGGICGLKRYHHVSCEKMYDVGLGYCDSTDYYNYTVCNDTTVQSYYRDGATIYSVCDHDELYYGSACHAWTTFCSFVVENYGRAYYLCGPARCQGVLGIDRPDATHGNGFGKARWDHDRNSAETGPSMGNCFGELESCAVRYDLEEDPPDFETVTAVIFEGVGGPWWDDQFGCTLGVMKDFHYAADIPGLGIYNYDKTDTLSHFENNDDTVPCPEEHNWIQGQVAAWGEVCMGSQVWVSIDLNLVNGVPTLRDYNLGIANPFDDCPCETWTADPWACV